MYVCMYVCFIYNLGKLKSSLVRLVSTFRYLLSKVFGGLGKVLPIHLTRSKFVKSSNLHRRINNHMGDFCVKSKLPQGNRYPMIVNAMKI